LARADALLRVGSWSLPLFGQNKALREVGELKVEANGLFERTVNVLKLVGDQYLSRLYRLLAARLHLIDSYAALIAPFLVDAFNVFLMRGYIEQLPEDLEEAARVDGASEWRIFFSIVLPLARPALAVVGINTFLVNWNNFLYPLILTNSESMRTLPVGLALYAQGEHSVDWGHLMAGSAIATLPILAAFLVFQKHIIEGITAGAGK
jgi:multiple sugar transport system permease protein